MTKQNNIRNKLNTHMRGDLQIEVYDVNKQKTIRKHTIRNTITFDGTNSIINLWAQDGIDPTDWEIDSLKVGSNSTPPTRADTGLGSLVISKTLGVGNRIKSLPTGELIIQVQLATTDAVGFTLREAGLFFKNTKLGMRQIFPEIVKTSALTVAFTWRLGVTA
jgi:hypothetical protein